MSYGNIRKTIFSRDRLSGKADQEALPDWAAATLAIGKSVSAGQGPGAYKDAAAERADPATGTSSTCENQRPVRCQSPGGQHRNGALKSIIEKKKDCHGGNRSSRNRGTIRQIRLPCLSNYNTKV